MRKLLLVTVLILSSVFSACEKAAAERIISVQFPAYPIENPQGIKQIDMINSANKFTVTAVFPDTWTIQEVRDNESSVPMGEFYTPLFLFEGEKLIGYIGFDCFEPYQNEDELPAGSYYQTVYPKLRLSSLFQWDPYTPIVATGAGETGIAEIHYKNLDELRGNPDLPMAEVQELETVGILSYHKELKVYIGIAFCPDTVSRALVEKIAKSIQLTAIDG